MRIIITGAAGLIGREIVKDLSADHDLCLVDRFPVPGYQSTITDLSQCDGRKKLDSNRKTVTKRQTDPFKNAHIVIHLAEESNPNASWERVYHNNVKSTWNVFQACSRNDVRRIIYASSNWAVKALELELAPACYDPEGPKIGSGADPRPVNPYGIGKTIGEMMGRIMVDENRISSFVALRIGWFNPNPPNNGDYTRLAIGVHDLRSLFRRCVEAEFDGFHIIYGVSAQKISPYDMSYTTNLLSWEPEQIPP